MAELVEFFSHRCSLFPIFKSRCKLFRKDSHMSSQLTAETVCSVNSPLPLSPPDLLNLNASSLDLLDYPPPLTLRFLGLAFLLWFVSNTNKETSLHRDNLCLFQRKGHNRSLTVAPAHPHQLDYAALPPFLSLIPTDLLM